MRLLETDYPVWEAFDEATFYEMKGGGAGLPNEAGYRIAEFNRRVKSYTGLEAKYSAAQVLQYHHALMQGGTRAWGKYWGTAIYGHCETNVASLALSVAYDMGARYFWFWSSDHDNHIPWPEQLSMTRGLKEHFARTPRPSIYGPAPTRGAVIVLPSGSLLSSRKYSWDQGQDAETLEVRKRCRAVVRKAFEAMNERLAQDEDFDFTIDDGRKNDGYARVIRIGN